MTPRPFDRRSFLRAAALASVATLAGCGGDGDSNVETPTAAATEADGGSGGASGGGGGGGGDSSGEHLDEEPDYGGYLEGANGYEGTVDVRGEDEVTVDVGAHGGLGFDPAAVAISTGTTVTWEWIGQGGTHNVVDNDGNFESDRVDSDEYTFSQTFDEAGTYTYFCEPHESLDMKGGVYVE